MAKACMVWCKARLTIYLQYNLGHRAVSFKIMNVPLKKGLIIQGLHCVISAAVSMKSGIRSSDSRGIFSSAKRWTDCAEAVMFKAVEDAIFVMHVVKQHHQYLYPS